MLKPPAGAAELLAQLAQSRAEIAQLTTLASRRAMEPEAHRIALEAARDGERRAMEGLAKKFAHRAAKPDALRFVDLIQAAREGAETNPGEIK
jgi:DNA-binding FadR family transcriptional regulator